MFKEVTQLKKYIVAKKKITSNLRNMIKRKCKSPHVKNIYSEIYIKSINSFAFNLIALDTEQNNYNLKKNKKYYIYQKNICRI